MTIIDIGMANLTNYRLWLQLVPVLTIIDHSDVVAPTGCTVPPWWTEMRPYLGKLCWCPKAFRARRGKQRTSFAWQAQHLVLCKGSDVCPGVPWSPLLCRWLLRGRGGTWCSARGSDVRPGVPWSPVAFAWQARHLVLWVQCTPWRPLVSAGFCVAGAALGALQGVGCTPWRPLVSAALPVAFAWQARHLVLCKGSDVRSGVPWSPVAFAWQARHLVLCKRSDVCRGVPWSPLLCRWLLRGRRSTWCSARGRMYALASLGLRCSAGGFCVAGAALGALQGVGCTPWRPLVSAALPVAFAWQARHLVLCKGSDVRPGVPWSPLLCRWLLRGRRSTWCSARGRMYALASLGLWWLLRGRRGTWCSARGRMYAVASLGLRCSAGGFCVAGAALAALHWHKPVCYNLLSRVMLIK